MQNWQEATDQLYAVRKAFHNVSNYFSLGVRISYDFIYLIDLLYRWISLFIYQYNVLMYVRLESKPYYFYTDIDAVLFVFKLHPTK